MRDDTGDCAFIHDLHQRRTVKVSPGVSGPPGDVRDLQTVATHLVTKKPLLPPGLECSLRNGSLMSPPV